MIATPPPITYPVGMTPARSPLSAIRLAVVLTEDERKRRIAYFIRRGMAERGLKAPQVAAQIGVGRGTVNDWADGRSTPSLVHLGPLSLALGVAPSLFAELPPIPEDPIAAYLLPHEETAGPVRGRRSLAAGNGGPLTSDDEDLAVLELEAEAAQAAEERTGPPLRQSGPRSPEAGRSSGPPQSSRVRGAQSSRRDP